MYRFMSKQFIALFAGLHVLCSIQFISPPKMRGLILRRKTGTVSVKVFTFHTPGGGGGGGVLPKILDRGVPRRFLNPNPI